MKKKSPDYILIFVVAALLLLGILMIFSVSASISRNSFGNTYYFFNHQLLFGLIPGLILAFLAFKIRLQFFKRWALILLLINLILAAMVFLPSIGVKAGGAARWLNLGIITIQPSEFLKLTFIIYLSAWLSARLEGVNLKNPGKNFNQTFAAFSVLISLITLLLVLQPDVSTLGIIIITGSLIYFFSGTPIWHMILLILVGSLSLFSFIKIAHYRTSRFLVFLKPETEPMGIGYQITQALIAAGSGGLFGLGLGMSQQKFGFLPETLADSIFAVYLEETGFVGGALLVLLFLVLFWRGFTIGFHAKDKFSQILAFGVSIWITIQAFINMGSMLGLLPLAGVPLPFISYGGSALVSELMGVGVLLNISKNL